MPLRRLLVLLLLLPLLLACERGPRLSPLDEGATILAFGDSLTYGTGAALSESYPAILEGLIGRRVVNAGIPGEVSATGLARLPALLDEHRPALVILCHGGNDLLQRHDDAEIAANLKGMVEIARAAGAEVLLVAVPRPGLLLDAAPFYAEVAKELQLPCEDEALADILQDGSLKSDYIHPNAKGYALFATTLAKRIPTPADR